MKALRRFSVRPSLPAELEPLHKLAMNLRWSWSERTRDAFRWVDPDTWEDVRHDPMRLLGTVRPERLRQLAADPGFLRFMEETEQELRRALTGPRWFQIR